MKKRAPIVRLCEFLGVYSADYVNFFGVYSADYVKFLVFIVWIM